MLTSNHPLTGARRWIAAGVVFLITAPAVMAGSIFQDRQTRPIQLGTSGGNIEDIKSSVLGEACFGGTLGGLVKDSNGTQYILSNNHVMARSNAASPGETIVQPSLVETGCQPIDADGVADLSDFVALRFGLGSLARPNQVDAAIAQVRPGKVDPSGAILQIGTLSDEIATPRLGCEVQKSGSRTGRTTGTVSAVDVSTFVRYGLGKRAFYRGQFMVGSASFSDSGDSGSVITRSGSSPRAVGLLFAGSSSTTIGNPIADVLEALNVTMVGSGDGSGDCPDGAGAALARARAVKKQREGALLQRAGVLGIGVGHGPAIEIYVERSTDSLRRSLPTQLDNVPVRIVETGVIEAR